MMLPQLKKCPMDSPSYRNIADGDASSVPRFIELNQTAADMLKKIPKHLKPPGRCIFCSQGKLSGEHLWPQWSHSLLPDAPLSETSAAMRDRHLNATGDQYLRKKQGGVKKLKHHCTCIACNSEWMSRLEMAVRPVLTPLILGKIITPLGKERRRILAEWIMLKAMILDGSSKNSAFTPDQRKAFYESREIPSGIRIYLFCCGHPDWQAISVRRLLLPKPNTSDQPLMFTTVGIGELVYMVQYDPGGAMQPTPETANLRVELILDWEAEELFPPVWPPHRCSATIMDALADPIAVHKRHKFGLPQPPR